MYFVIDTDNNVTACDAIPPAENGIVVFRTEDHFRKATAEWPAARLAEIWNGFAGTPGFAELRPVKKFETRAVALQRIWQAIQRLAETAKAKAAKPAPKKDDRLRIETAPAAQETTATEKPVLLLKDVSQRTIHKMNGEPKAARPGSKTATILDLIGRKGGATMAELMEATGWRRAMVQSYLSWTIRKRLGRNVERIEGRDGAPARYAVAQ